MKTTYKVYDVFIGKSYWGVTVATGQYKSVSVTKKTANPFGGVIGTEFSDFDEAVRHYKSAALKTALLKIETGLVEPTHAAAYINGKEVDL